MRYKHMEEWKDIEGYEGLYQISNKGRVRSLERYVRGRGDSIQKVKGGIKSVYKMSDGYYGVTLNRNDKSSIKKIARLVAKAFIPNPNNLPQVNHKNELKDDNNVENLEWCDASYNINYGTRSKRVAEHFSKKSVQDVIGRRNNCNL